MIPKIQKCHIFYALNWVDGHSVPVARQPYNWVLQHGGKGYPPKYVISLAVKEATGKELLSSEFNAQEARSRLVAMGFKVCEINVDVKSEDFETRYPEGKEKYVTHRELERNSKVGKKAKNMRLAKSGELKCDVCSFSFAEVYGLELGGGFIEAHHTVPVSKMQKKGKLVTKVEDIALVCANCHRMLHSGAELLSISALRNIVDKYRQK